MRERTAEIGLPRALGAQKVQVLRVFLSEAIVLSAIGGIAGLAVGVGIDGAVPVLPVSYSPMFMLLAEALVLLVGLAAGILPALQAAGLEPVEALRTE